MTISGADADRQEYLVLGLGNVGSKYCQSRHNIGFDVIDSVAARLKLRFIPGPGDYYVSKANQASSDPWWRRLLGLASTPGASPDSGPLSDYPEQPGLQHALLFKPTTFMNRSGQAARQILERYDYPAERLLVITDDFHLPLGSVRLRQSGSDGGHNGLASIIHALGVDNFPRLRVGIGPKPPNTEIVKFVLSGFGPSEANSRAQAINHAASACLHLLRTESKNALAQTMSKYNIVSPDPAPGSGAGEAS